ncbi:hypothetical protein [Ornithinimicrobium panacihumi]|uniref:hypothetical protein n=1 Tax=Ornithinimicrobium panacihumi TaxID=2008449 RepID=UPI003F8C2F8F
MVKDHEARTVPVPAQVWPLVLAMMQGKRATDHLMATINGSMLHESNFRRSPRWSRTAPRRTLHDLRHSAATEWLRAGVDDHGPGMARA